MHSFLARLFLFYIIAYHFFNFIIILVFTHPLFLVAYLSIIHYFICFGIMLIMYSTLHVLEKKKFIRLLFNIYPWSQICTLFIFLFFIDQFVYKYLHSIFTFLFHRSINQSRKYTFFLVQDGYKHLHNKKSLYYYGNYLIKHIQKILVLLVIIQFV